MIQQGISRRGTSRIIPSARAAAYKVGRYYKPQWAVTNAGITVTTTATRLYYAPIYIREKITFAGAAAFNSGAGDNAETLRLGVYTDSSGVPGTLVTDFGEITLSGAAAVRDLTAAAALTVGWYWLCAHHNTAAAMYGMTEQHSVTAAGYIAGADHMFQNEFGLLGLDTTSIGSVGAFYVDTAYGALASNAVAPTATAGVAPAIWLKA